ncbi:MAG: RagB/SusD family nutrient uptake outer membrane protein [Bacteroidales bacterium]|nr:RagB/SusD family nutrient uptake outer membrane protein [Bacteroidales bacterium]
MKKIFAFIAVTVILAASCDRMLEEVNYGSPTTKDLMTNEENVALLVGQCYADVKWLHDHWGYWGVVTLTADEGLNPTRMPDKDWEDGGYWKNLNTHNWNEMGNAFKNIWNTTIQGAVLCNKLLKTLENSKESMSDAVYAQFVGELEVMRSYYYYMLFDCFGRIPYLEEFVDRAEDPLMEAPDVWSHLVNCLEKNAPNLPKVKDENTRALYYGRATQGLAYALLARLYLNAESFGCTPDNITIDNEYTTNIAAAADFYTNCVRCCDAIIDAKSYSIEPSFFTNFKIDNSASKENIFVIVENGAADVDERSGGDGMMLNKLRIALLTLNYNHQKTYKMQETPWNGFCARPSFIDRYNASDVRGPGNEGLGTKNTKDWGWFVGPIYDATGNLCYDKDEKKSDAIIVKDILDADGNVDETLSKVTDLSGARCIKYEIDKAGKYKYSENDFVLFRYADILWMKEEAILRGGTGTSGWTTDANFTTLRKRAFAYSADGEAAYNAAYPEVLTLDGILDERGREFAWENMRRRDLIRFDKFNDDTYVQFVTAKDDYRKWFPIPFSVLEKSVRDANGDPVWTQNEGY